MLLAGLVLGHADGRDLRQRVRRVGDRAVVEAALPAAEDLVRDRPGRVVGDGREHRLAGVRAVADRPDVVGRRLREVVHADALLAGLHAGGFEVQPRQVRRPPQPVDDHVRLQRLLLAGLLVAERRAESAAVPLHADHVLAEAQPHAVVPQFPGERLHEVRVELREDPVGPLDDRRLPPVGVGDARELRGDVPPAEEHDRLRQLVEEQELVAGGQQVRAGEVDRRRLRAGGDDDAVGGQRPPVDLQRPRPREPGAAGDRRDSVVFEGRLRAVRHALDVGLLVVAGELPGQLRVVLAEVAVVHRVDPPHQLGGPRQHLLGVAAAQRAGAPEVPRLDDGHGHPGVRGVVGDLRARAAAQNDEVVRFVGHARSVFATVAAPAIGRPRTPVDPAARFARHSPPSP